VIVPPNVNFFPAATLTSVDAPELEIAVETVELVLIVFVVPPDAASVAKLTALALPPID
jgi:hypothetical protein